MKSASESLSVEEFAVLFGGWTMRIHKALFASLLLVLFAIAPSAFAQFSSNLQGVAADNTGAVIPGAEVTLRNTETGVTQVTKTGSQGDYRFVSLAPGPYEV